MRKSRVGNFYRINNTIIELPLKLQVLRLTVPSLPGSPAFPGTPTGPGGPMGQTIVLAVKYEFFIRPVTFLGQATEYTATFTTW